MTKPARIDRIKEYLRKKGSATITELAEVVGVSHMTIRRDLETIPLKEHLRIIHGGVLFHEEEDEHKDRYSLSIARVEMLEEKKRIARKAVSLIESGDIIIIDAGSTGELIATYLPENIPLTIICSALNIAYIVSSKPNCALIVSGGYYHRSSMVLESNEGLNLLKQNRANKTFITASGVSLQLGVTCSNFFERTTKQTALEAAITKILVADSSKFGMVKTGHFADIDDFDIIITDKGVGEKTLTPISKIEHLQLFCV